MSSITESTILVTGATGFLGRHVTEALEETGGARVVGVGRADYDLLQPGRAEAMLKEIRPDSVVHLAAKVGGIIANRNHPADFYHENLSINTRVFHASHLAGVGKFLTFIGGCSYPALADSPIPESAMWGGYPQPESAAYSVAKKMMLVQSAAYREQFGFNSVVLIPGNVYGEHDNFDFEYSHVIPALIRRFTEAREQGAKTVTCYGSGRPVRDFVYAGDIARLVPWFLDHYDSSEPVNLSTGTPTSIRELAGLVRDVTGFEGGIRWDQEQPDGQLEKVFDVRRLLDLGMRCGTPLREGLERTVDWFRRSRNSGAVRL